MLVELAIGDAYGAAFEYASPAFVKEHNRKPLYVNHPSHKQGPGRYTDDTQMSLAVAEVLIEHKLHGTEFTPRMLADSFVRCFKRDVRVGYAGNFYHFLKSISSGEEFLEKIRPESDKSGAAMRACPLGILPDIDEVKSLCEMQAKLTHDTADGVDAALAASLAAHYTAYRIDKRDKLGKWLEKQVPGHPWDRAWRGKVGSKGWMSVSAAVTVIKECRSATEALYQCVDFTGDVDTVACIALACLSEDVLEHDGQDLPGSLYDGLEDGKFGYKYLDSLDEKLLACGSLPQ